MFHKNLFDILVSRVESPNERENLLFSIYSVESIHTDVRVYREQCGEYAY